MHLPKKIKILSEKLNALYIAFILIIILLLGIGVISFKANNEVYEASAIRKDLQKELTLLGSLRSSLIIADDIQERYFVDPNQETVKLYKNKIEKIRYELERLSSLYKNQFQNFNNINLLNELFNNRIHLLNHAMKLEPSERSTTAVLDFYENSRAIQKILSTIEKEQYDLLNARDEGVNRTIKNTSFSILIGTIISCSIFLFIFYLLSKEIDERKKIEKMIRREMMFSQRLINSSIDGIIAFDKNCNYTLWNPGMEALTGIPARDVISKNAFECFPVLKNLEEDKYFYETLTGSYVTSKDRWMSIHETGKEFYYEAHYSPIIDSSKNVIGGLAIFRNTTQRKIASEQLEKAKESLEKRVKERTSALLKVNADLKKEIEQRKIVQAQINQSLQEKVILLQEIHHRVKNNLQVISSLLNLQSGYLEDEKSIEVFRESQNRVRSMALIHERLYQSKDLNKIEFGEYIKSLCKDLFNSYNVDPNRIKLNLELEGIFFEIDTSILCGLIVNELISNSLKHAFPGKRQGEIYVRIYCIENNQFVFKIGDTGIGFPKKLDFRKTNSLGLQLVNTLTEQLGGKIELNDAASTEFTITIPHKSKS